MKPAEPTTLASTELALAGVTLAACLGLSRVFADASFLPPLVLIAGVAHLVAIVSRRRGLPGPVVALVVSVAGIVVTSLVLYPFATWWGLPGPDIVRTIGDDLQDAWSTFLDLAPPVPVRRGFLVIIAAVLWPLVAMADRAAFVNRSPALALVPAGALFVATSLFEGARHRIITTMLFALATLVFVAVHRIDLSRGEPVEALGHWLPHDHTRGAWAMGRAGAALAAGVVVATAVIGPNIPGVDGAALVDWRTTSGDGGSRITVSPLVDIRTRLVELSAQEVFTVRSPVRAYWRLTALDTFTGTIWASNGSYEEAEGAVPGEPTTAGPTTEALQRFSVTGLEALWLPAAFEARRISAPTDVRWDAESSTLVVDDDRATSDELAYDVLSAVPTYDPALLRTATDPPPAPIADRYLALPRDFSEEARTLATGVVAGTSTDYDAALALQNFFRDNFEYSTDVGAGHSASDIDDFLDPERGRVGYCEQFAGTYAALARAVGIPARVAVGFTPGDVDDEGIFHVRGEHAHAWPEVHLTGIGWVPFEPTPTRGAPGAEGFTGVPEQQATPIEGTSGPAPFPTVTAGPGSAGPETPDSIPEPADSGDQGSRDSSPSVTRWLVRVAVVVAVLAAAYGVLVPTGHLLRRWRRRRRAGRGPAPAVRGAWTEATEAWARAGVPVGPADTPLEIGRNADAALGSPEPTGAALAGLASRVAYGAGDTSPDTAEVARSLARASIDRARVATPWGARARGWLDARALTPRA